METDMVVDKQQIEKIEEDLAFLSSELIALLKDHKERGLIDEVRFEKEIKVKEMYLNYFNNKKR
ncbi:hypothetical protein Amet_3172 [Alkaliphilus metalliredigens QYMF]|uniref:Uncharacterized protein n=1 Tax=Alkaliphilus metalliredigens (strain QYMF) TaxID=293826 RepID=A6TSZ3_ALKMQ|nr:hypothetical protein [Alkaliphilus metalliredigens]ABR49311.1 hypothetical protein Amet_3172 [Alkaliphilus metalliredigens QYMF]